MSDALLDLMAEHAILGSARGKSAGPLSMVLLRELTDADYEVLANPPSKGIASGELKRLRTSHHHLARLLAEGCKPGECSAITGYSPSRVSVLQADPAMQELIAYYKEQVQAKYLDVHERLAVLGGSAIDEIKERMEENPGEISTGQLLSIAEFAFDRSVAPAKGGKNAAGAGAVGPIQVNLNFNTAKADGDGPSVMLDITPKEP